MEAIFKNMDFLIKHWAPYARRFPAAYPLVSTDFLRQKRGWVRHQFTTCNFSLILRGAGEYHRCGKKWRVEAPCVITQWPGDYLEYGPDLPEGSWDELYLIYEKKYFNRFRENGLIDPDRPVWTVADAPGLAGPITELAALTRSKEPESVVDRVDRVCERLILETWLKPRPPRPAISGMQMVLLELEKRLAEPVDFEEMAARYGMSGPTFRRRWQEVFDVPPARYLQELRMRKACRLLAESEYAIREIAALVGFQDEFYFSRRFHLEQGRSPRDYRKAYRLNRS